MVPNDANAYQLRSSKNHSGFQARSLFFHSPHLRVPGLAETGPWVWRLQYLSTWTKPRAVLWHDCVPVCLCVFLSLPTSAAAIPVIWYQDPTVCKSIQYSLQSLRQTTRRWGGVRGLGDGLISYSYRSAVEKVPFSLASAEGQNTFLVPGQHPDFKPSLLEEANCLRNSLLELVLYSCHT